MDKDEQIRIKIPKKMKEEFFETCKKNGMSASAVLRLKIEQFCREYKNKKIDI